MLLLYSVHAPLVILVRVLEVILHTFLVFIVIRNYDFDTLMISFVN